MSADFISTRVNGGMLGSMAGRDVRVVGKVLQQANGSAVLEASDGASVRVAGANDAFASAYVEVIGRVNADGSVQQHAFANFGDVFDLKGYDGYVRLLQKTAVGGF